jgi:hypothetical protein
MPSYKVDKQTVGSSRWWIMSEIDEWPHRSLVIKCDTKRCATALVSILTARELTDEQLVRAVLTDTRNAHRDLGDRAGRFAIDSFVLVLLRTGNECMPKPAWWSELEQEILIGEDRRESKC